MAANTLTRGLATRQSSATSRRHCTNGQAWRRASELASGPAALIGAVERAVIERGAAETRRRERQQAIAHDLESAARWPRTGARSAGRDRGRHERVAPPQQPLAEGDVPAQGILRQSFRLRRRAADGVAGHDPQRRRGARDERVGPAVRPGAAATPRSARGRPPAARRAPETVVTRTAAGVAHRGVHPHHAEARPRRRQGRRGTSRPCPARGPGSAAASRSASVMRDGVADVARVAGHEREHADRQRRQAVGLIAALRGRAVAGRGVHPVADRQPRQAHVLPEGGVVQQAQLVGVPGRSAGPA